MRRVLLVDDDPTFLDTCQRGLRLSGFEILIASSVAGAVSLITNDLSAAVIDYRLPDGDGLDVLRALQGRTQPLIPSLMVSGYGTTRVAVEAFKLGAVDFIEKPVLLDELVGRLERIAPPSLEATTELTAHAAMRWARSVVPIVTSPTDIRTIPEWGRLIAAAPGTVRNWCHTAGIRTRRSLIFGRLLRVVALSDGGRHRPEDLLDVVDRRTLVSLFRLTGLRNLEDIPTDVSDFIDRQCLIKNEEALKAVRALLPRYLKRCDPHRAF